MNRRNFVTAAAGAGLAIPALAAETKRSFFVLRRIQMRNSHEDQVRRTSEHLEKTVMPALQRAGAGPMGFFSGVIASDSPFILMVVSFPTLAALETTMQKMDADKEFQKGFEQFNSGPEPGFARVESSLLRAFRTTPEVETPPAEENRPPRVFELRIYESPNFGTLQRKIKMFDEGEIDIFRRCGLLPVFFGETLFGRNMPNLTYMVAFDDMAAREKAWNTFRVDPDWLKLRKRPDLADAEIVSNISNAILRPLPFSPIR